MANSLRSVITFEQPMNEYIRVCLRLEKLFQQLKKHLHADDSDHARLSFSAILKILDIINRPDLKSKLTQALTQHACTLGQLEQFPQVDPERLRGILQQLDIYIASLHKNHRKIAERLQQNEFLTQMRLQMGSPGGINEEKAPAYKLWLNQPRAKRADDITSWTIEFEELSGIVDLLLFLIRESTPTQTISCKDGFYHQSLDPTLNCELIRITVPAHLNIYPEISVGRHRINIRFLEPNYLNDGHPAQIQKPVDFELSCCRL